MGENRMSNTILPVHHWTGVQAIGVRRNGDPIWPILGGAEDDEEPPEESPEGDETEGDESGESDESEDDSEGLGGPGKKALASMKGKWRSERDRRRAVEEELAELKRPQEAKEPDPEQLRKDAEARANQRILKAEVKAAAAGKLADPTDAHAFLDLSQFEVGEDGAVDAEELSEAIEDLLSRKPYLAVGKQKKFGPSDGGPRGTKPKSLQEQIADAEKQRDWQTVRALKAQQLAGINPASK